MSEWWDFRREVFGDPYHVWHDGPSFELLLRADLAVVKTLLPQGIREGDDVAAMAYAALFDAGVPVDDAVPLLVSALPDAQGRFKVAVAGALHRLTGSAEWSAPIVAVLQGPESEFERLTAAIALTDFPPTAELILVVAGAVRDHAYLVRYHAARTLLAYAGRRPPYNIPKRIFDRLAPDDATAQWEEAARMLLALPGLQRFLEE